MDSHLKKKCIVHRDVELKENNDTGNISLIELKLIIKETPKRRCARMEWRVF